MLPYRDSRFIRIILTLFFILAIAYAIYEAQGILYGPVIDIPSGTVTVHEAFTSIRGHAERISELRLDGKSINVTESGEFDEPYLLAAGSNRILLEARDAHGRTVTKTLDIIYIPASGTAVQSPPDTSSSTTTEN